MRSIKSVFVVAALCALVSSMSCAALSSACAASLTYVAKTTAMLGEASVAVDQVHAFVSQTPDMSDGDRKRELDQVYRARGAIQAAQHAMAGATSACTKPDIAASLKEFSKAWAILRGVISVVGGVGAPKVLDPIAYDPSV